MPNQYEINNVIRVTGSFLVGSTPTDPTTVTIKIKSPGEVISTYIYVTDPEVVKDSVGVFHLDLTADEVGFWYYNWIGTGAVIASAEGYFEIKSTEF